MSNNVTLGKLLLRYSAVEAARIRDHLADKTIIKDAIELTLKEIADAEAECLTSTSSDSSSSEDAADAGAHESIVMDALEVALSAQARWHQRVHDAIGHRRVLAREIYKYVCIYTWGKPRAMQAQCGMPC